MCAFSVRRSWMEPMFCWRMEAEAWRDSLLRQRDWVSGDRDVGRGSCGGEGGLPAGERVRVEDVRLQTHDTAA